MIDLEDRQSLAHDIHTAHKAGARLRLACETAGIDVRTLQRWNAGEGLVSGDGRPHAVRPQPAHALSAAGAGLLAILEPQLKVRPDLALSQTRGCIGRFDVLRSGAEHRTVLLGEAGERV